MWQHMYVFLWCVLRWGVSCSECLLGGVCYGSHLSDGYRNIHPLVNIRSMFKSFWIQTQGWSEGQKWPPPLYVQYVRENYCPWKVFRVLYSKCKNFQKYQSLSFLLSHGWIKILNWSTLEKIGFKTADCFYWTLSRINIRLILRYNFTCLNSAII